MAYTMSAGTSYEQQVQADLASSNPNTQTAGIYGASIAPSLAQTQLQFAGVEQQLGDLGPALAQQSDYANLMAGYQLGGLGITAEQQALGMQGTTQQYGIQQQQFGITAAQQQLAAQRQMQSAVGSAASSGAMNSVGNQQAQSDIAQQYAWQKQTLQGQEQLAAGDYARAQQSYGLMAQANGISQQEVYARLQYGLNQLGISMDPSSLVSQAAGSLSGGAQDAGSILAQAGLTAGLNTIMGLG